MKSVLCLTVVIFGFSLYLPTRQNETTTSSYGKTAMVTRSENFSDQMLNSTAVYEYLDTITDASKVINDNIGNEVEDMLNRIRKGNTTGASANDFLFSVSIVRESAAKVIAHAAMLRLKVGLLNKEKSIRELTARLIPEHYRNSALESWFDSKYNELTEGIINLRTHFTELSNAFQNHMNFLIALIRRLAVAESYYPSEPTSPQPDEFSTTETTNYG